MLDEGGHLKTILEREDELAKLSDLLSESGSSGGRLVLVRGEAGIGKSTLVNRFLADSQERAHTHLGACDDLLTPQPFGPMWDIARDEPSLVQPLTDGNRRAVMEATLDLLMRSLRPTVLVLEDTQWADEATLDLIKFLGRRISRTNGILILTYRDVEVDADHPLRQVIGDLPPGSLVRMPLGQLSADAIASMTDGSAINVDELLALTGGNPLFVAEVLASGADDVPLSVRDAVLARSRKLGPEARNVLDLVSVVPGEIERWLVDEIASPTEDQLAECVRQGLLRTGANTVSFTHDLQRRTIENALSESDRQRHNQQILDLLRESSEPARLVHHAAEAGDIGAIVVFAPRAARAAMGIESTTEAIAHFRTLEPYLDRVELRERAAILNDWAAQEYYADNPETVDLFDRAIACLRIEGDDRLLASTLTFAGRANASHARPVEAMDYAKEAITILEPYGPSSDLAKALSHLAFLEFFYTDRDDAVLPLVDRAISIAEDIGDAETVTNTLNVKAHLIFSRGDAAGMTLMEDSLRSAQKAGDHWGEVRALSNMAGMYGDVRDMSRATDFAHRARETAARYEIRSVEATSMAHLCEFLLWKGDWAGAEDAAAEALRASAHNEQIALRVLGTIQARRGRTEARSAIFAMWSLVHPDEGATIVDTAATAMAEYLWLSDEDNPELARRLKDVLADGISLGTPWPSGAFAFWMWKLGLLDEAPEGTADFYGWIIKGEHEKSVDFWHERGIPYEEGLALMHGDHEAQVNAIRIFEDLGATATANKVRHLLADHGVTVHRGKSRATRDHAAGLTARQDEVLRLLARGLTNTEIADELFVSQRTVENHVSAVLMKLDVPNREAAVESARAQGMLEPA
jgi:DNA-binding CsgD family transcriptional regulator/tetratricopeptide (TPR) repeat protein